MATILLSRQHSRLWRDYLELTKPKVVALLVLTAARVGMVLASDSLASWPLLISATLGIGLLSAAAAALNHVVDQRIDAQMARPVTAGSPWQGKQ
ncbi:protoheme IX farnesyltransferase [Alishewanella longhuensis]